MIDFKAHLAKGYNAHEKAATAKAEVDSVLKELDKQVQEFTNYRVGITLKQELASFSADIMNSVAQLTGTPTIPEPINTQSKLVAYDISKGTVSHKSLALWTQSNKGYPCTLRFNNAKHEAHDRKSLEMILADLLTLSETGRIISSIESTGAVIKNN